MLSVFVTTSEATTSQKMNNISRSIEWNLNWASFHDRKQQLTKPACNKFIDEVIYTHRTCSWSRWIFAYIRGTRSIGLCWSGSFSWEVFSRARAEGSSYKFLTFNRHCFSFNFDNLLYMILRVSGFKTLDKDHISSLQW